MSRHCEHKHLFEIILWYFAFFSISLCSLQIIHKNYSEGKLDIELLQQTVADSLKLATTSTCQVHRFTLLQNKKMMIEMENNFIITLRQEICSEESCSKYGQT